MTSVILEDGEPISTRAFLRLNSWLDAGTIRLWQTTPGKTYGLWQGHSNGG